MKHIKHLPYKIDPEASRNAYYETLWKIVALGLLQKHIPNLNGKTLLDYGSGRGETLNLAKQLGMEPVGTDTDPECVRLSSEFAPSELLQTDSPVSQFGEQKFDIVSCFHVLEHVPSPVTTLNHIRDIARHYVLVAVPNGRQMPDIFRPERNVHEVNEGHLQNWDHSHFLNLAERHCRLKLVEWGFDHVKIPILSNQALKFFGKNITIRLETGIFIKLFPYQATSIIGLFRVVES